MDREQHIKRHKKLHEAFDELAADYISHTKKSLSETSILTLMQWSNEQTKNPTDKGFEFMNEPATDEQKKMIIDIYNERQIPIDPNGPWPHPFTKWDAATMIETLKGKGVSRNTPSDGEGYDPPQEEGYGGQFIINKPED